jgi:hypothetical protein
MKLTGIMDSARNEIPYTALLDSRLSWVEEFELYDLIFSKGKCVGG